MYDSLLAECNRNNIEVYERDMRNKGLYSDGVIWINKKLSPYEKCCVLAEEVGHYYTSMGDILDQKDIRKRKQEMIARRWAYDKLVPLDKIIQAHKNGIRNRFELAEFIGVTEPFLNAAINSYIQKYGDFINYKKYTITFNPLGVLEWLE
ncbi:ImmA/IrrE family metallo-endopeptidase [Shouchella clausii]|uniref:Phage-related protein n=1 Tax=Shouchella clausii (strain KSM-K16) TaxID=66692 RepID=Q5WIA9_SHOC1|nr:ImmA/IrrE family metallo-endopeptidase [Shouchella clausii]AST97309.1 ImmA/IrrE family metallo-endopeptidase [Shouchella clausii]PAD46674.1 ImmA/IrrE family metallo-endopeptidase [Shouchella clausii]WQG93466.1 ImmA/IrrE family metallo-endopeptidase [Shouchella clausii]BAD63896.1 phage-related protein [Shouchella clausii KSM-K16]